MLVLSRPVPVSFWDPQYPLTETFSGSVTVSMKTTVLHFESGLTLAYFDVFLVLKETVSHQ